MSHGYGTKDASDINSGRVVKLVAPAGRQPFGFIAPDSGGKDVWFAPHLLGDGKSWDEFKVQVGRYGTIPAPVSYVLDPKGRAKGVCVLSLAEVDGNDDGRISEEEMAKYLEAHPEMFQKVKTQMDREREKRQEERDAEHAAWVAKRKAEDAAYHKRKVAYQEQVKDDEAEAQERQELYARLAAKEDALRAKIEETKARRDSLKEQVNQLRDEAQKDWESGAKAECKAKQAKANELQEERSGLYKEVDDLYDQLKNLDWSNNEEIFRWVQKRHDRPSDLSWFDLHGLDLNFAWWKATELLKAAQTLGVPRVEVITGAGHHSEGGVSRLKQTIWTNSDSLLRSAKSGQIDDLHITDFQQVVDDDGDQNPGTVMVLF
ncbi:unnamed protein product [Symbiodinium natans]|uniref:Smr domain-containing protein n=1 Tax=Symbiodinium natans TaxID=878477 RepID=A0A812V516_9DINO|nr:unnamed protein product [Symbiodinium natans]